MRDQARVLRYTAMAAFAELRTIYTWRTWLFAWLTRLLVQVAFFGLIGRMLGGQERVDFLVVGASVVIVALEAMTVILVATVERRAGTLALMVAAPSTHLTVYLGRGVHFLASGLVTSNIAFFVSAAVFGVRLPWPEVLLVPPLTAVIGVAAYCYGAFVASFVIGFPGLRWTALNLSGSVVTTFAGVYVPLSFWPDAIRYAAAVLPASHGLVAVRTLIGGGPASAVLANVALELAVAAGWGLLAALGFQRMVRRGRVVGSIDFDD
jgi:ABC-type multidrug transport system permease subunit